MKIIINDAKNQRTIKIPNWLLLSNVNAFMLTRTVGKESGMTFRQAHAFLSALKEYRKEHPEWVAVEVDCGDGTFVQISV